MYIMLSQYSVCIVILNVYIIFTIVYMYTLWNIGFSLTLVDKYSSIKNIDKIHIAKTFTTLWFLSIYVYFCIIIKIRVS